MSSSSQSSASFTVSNQPPSSLPTSDASLSMELVDGQPCAVWDKSPKGVDCASAPLNLVLDVTKVEDLTTTVLVQRDKSGKLHYSVSEQMAAKMSGCLDGSPTLGERLREDPAVKTYLPRQFGIPTPKKTQSTAAAPAEEEKSIKKSPEKSVNLLKVEKKSTDGQKDKKKTKKQRRRKRFEKIHELTRESSQQILFNSANATSSVTYQPKVPVSSQLSSPKIDGAHGSSNVQSAKEAMKQKEETVNLSAKVAQSEFVTPVDAGKSILSSSATDDQPITQSPGMPCTTPKTGATPFSDCKEPTPVAVASSSPTSTCYGRPKGANCLAVRTPSPRKNHSATVSSSAVSSGASSSAGSSLFETISPVAQKASPCPSKKNAQFKKAAPLETAPPLSMTPNKQAPSNEDESTLLKKADIVENHSTKTEEKKVVPAQVSKSEATKSEAATPQTDQFDKPATEQSLSPFKMAPKSTVSSSKRPLEFHELTTVQRADEKEGRSPAEPAKVPASLEETKGKESLTAADDSLAQYWHFYHNQVKFQRKMEEFLPQVGLPEEATQETATATGVADEVELLAREEALTARQEQFVEAAKTTLKRSDSFAQLIEDTSGGHTTNIRATVEPMTPAPSASNDTFYLALVLLICLLLAGKLVPLFFN